MEGGTIMYYRKTQYEALRSLYQKCEACVCVTRYREGVWFKLKVGL